VRVESSAQRERHEVDELSRVVNWTKGESPADFGDGRTGSPFQAQPFDEQRGSDTFERSKSSAPCAA
jgi:hypothetical protein